MAKGKRFKTLTASFRRLFSIRSGGSKSSSSRSSTVAEVSHNKKRGKIPESFTSASASNTYDYSDAVENAHIAIETHTTPTDTKLYPSLTSTCSTTTGYRSSTMESVS